MWIVFKAMQLFGAILLGFFGCLGTLVIINSLHLKLPESLHLYVVQSGSMSPHMSVGSVVLVTPTQKYISPISASRYQVNDIISYHAGPRVVTHRIVGIIIKPDGFYYQTQGDANNAQDEALISESAVVGEVVASAPYLGKIFAYARRPAGYLSMVLIPSLYILIAEILVIVDEIKQHKRTDDNLVVTA